MNTYSKYCEPEKCLVVFKFAQSWTNSSVLRESYEINFIMQSSLPPLPLALSYSDEVRKSVSLRARCLSFKTLFCYIPTLFVMPNFSLCEIRVRKVPLGISWVRGRMERRGSWSYDAHSLLDRVIGDWFGNNDTRPSFKERIVMLWKWRETLG